MKSGKGVKYALAIRIRLMRVGSRNNPRYRLVAADSRVARNGKFLEILGHYNPTTEPAEINVKAERVLHWLECGAQPTETALSLLKQEGIWQEFERRKRERKAARRAKLKAKRAKRREKQMMVQSASEQQTVSPNDVAQT